MHLIVSHTSLLPGAKLGVFSIVVNSAGQGRSRWPQRCFIRQHLVGMFYPVFAKVTHFLGKSIHRRSWAGPPHLNHAAFPALLMQLANGLDPLQLPIIARTSATRSR